MYKKNSQHVLQFLVLPIYMRRASESRTGNGLRGRRLIIKSREKGPIHCESRESFTLSRQTFRIVGYIIIFIGVRFVTVGLIDCCPDG